MREIVTDGAPTYGDAALSQGIEHGDAIYLAGQIGIDPETGELVSDDVAEQTAQVLENLQAVLEASGNSLDDVVQTTVYLSEWDHFETMNDVYREYMSEPYPARAAFAVKELASDADVEIQAIARA